MSIEESKARTKEAYERRKAVIRDMKEKYKDDPEMVAVFDDLEEKIDTMAKASLDIWDLMEEEE